MDIYLEKTWHFVLFGQEFLEASPKFGSLSYIGQLQFKQMASNSSIINSLELSLGINWEKLGIWSRRTKNLRASPKFGNNRAASIQSNVKMASNSFLNYLCYYVLCVILYIKQIIYNKINEPYC